MASPRRTFVTACILAAGKGTRMRSRVVKVLHPFLGRPMVKHLVDAAFRAGVDRVVTVVGHQGDEVRRAVEDGFPGWSLGFATQTEQRGTGHAVLTALPALSGASDVLVLYGDTPLLQSKTLALLLSAHHQSGQAMTISTFRAADPTGYGRIVRDANGKVVRIVEHADASEAERAINEVNAGMCVIRSDVLEAGLAALSPQNAQGELYLTDLVAHFATTTTEGVGACEMADAMEAQGVNTRSQLARLEAVALERIRQLWMERGVSMLDPSSTRIEADVEIGEDTVLGANLQLLGRTRIGHGCRIDAGAVLENCELGDFVHVRPYTVATHARLATGAEVGPFAHLRRGTELGERAKVGNFVETKQARLGPHSKASHLSYLGDCDIGRHVNIGAGTITCNYDGVDKHRTVLEDGVFVGSDTQLVAPVRIGKNATIAAGSTVVRDVPEGALVLSRSEQRVIEGYYDRHRKPRETKKKTARTAEREAAEASKKES